ncbi:MAG TPA: DHA2 family efflux MFS transporter permease subunit [Ktedonobacteraceae bacterium]|nr:DHA2 family efflux MFS transporter permease subunit [Ktedonobacteraceae bacterium]
MQNLQADNNQQVYARRWLALAALSFSILVISLDLTILNIALPTLVRDLAASTSQLQWMVDAYSLLYAGLLLTAGTLGDRFGRKRALIVGMLIFGAGSVWSAYSGSANMLIAARALMGMGGALIMPSTLSITANIFSNKQRASAIGVLTGVGGMGIVIGPLLGGWLLEHFTWGTIFLINVPIILITLLVSLWLVPESKDPQARRLDPAGALLSIAGLMALLYGIIEVPAFGIGDPRIIAAFSAAPVLLLAFVGWELHARSPMLDVKVFANAHFTAASMALTLTSFALAGTMFFLTQYLQLVLNYTPLQAGLCFIPLVLGLLVTASLSPLIARLTGVRATISSGLAIVAASIALFSFLNASSSYVLVGIILALLGAGLGLTMVTATNTIMGTLPLGKAGVGSAVNDTAQEVGGALGVAVLGSVLAASYHAAIDHAPVMQTLPAALKTLVHDSIGSASVLASHTDGSIGHLIATSANAAFIDSMSHTVLVAAGVSLCGMLVALFFLPSRAKDAQNLTESASLTTMERQKEETTT